MVWTDVHPDTLTYTPDGLIPAIVQQHDTGEVLMMAWMNAESLQQTIECGETVFFSRSRQTLWHKGATSGNTQRVISMATDCDRDTLLIRVDSPGPACHTGTRSCFDAHPSPAALASPSHAGGR